MPNTIYQENTFYTGIHRLTGQREREVDRLTGQGERERERERDRPRDIERQ
jgi:hypothetical protein